VNAVVRPAVRALLLDPDDRVLLVRFVNPETEAGFWTTPGGGIKPGESREDAIRRELLEETGLAEPEIGPVIWRRREVFAWAGRTLDQPEQIVLVRAPSFQPQPHIGQEGLMAENVHELRWWTLEEIEDSVAVFFPTQLGRFLRQLLETGAPPEPIDVGI
jgi:8-oxo-dGTP pyrophosphatase MutT (NUDIX family)